jgi:hypothetical protein
MFVIWRQALSLTQGNRTPAAKVLQSLRPEAS